MKSFFKKILRRLRDIYFKTYYGLTFPTYKAALTNRSFDSMSSILLWMIQSINTKYPNFNLNDKKVGEIGSGQFLSHPIGLKILGAREIISFDLYRQFSQKAASLSYSQQVMAKKFFSGYCNPSKYIKIMEEITKTNLNLNKLNEYGIHYLAPFDLQYYQDNDTFDLIISYTVLEHVPPRDITKLLTKSIKTLKIGGFFCHFIDLEDHKDSKNNPFEFLSIDKWNDSNCFSRGNKLRVNEWENIFNEIPNMEYEFVSILERSQELLPRGIEKKLNNYASGILVVGKKL